MKITSVDLYQVTSGKPSVAGTYWKGSKIGRAHV